MSHLGNKAQARKKILIWTEGERTQKTPAQWLHGYQTAERTYCQHIVALRGQGLAEAADRFAYRELVLQSKALWWQMKNRRFSEIGSYLFSLFLAVHWLWLSPLAYPGGVCPGVLECGDSTTT